MDNRKDREPVVGRLDEVDEAVEPLLGLRTDVSGRFSADGDGSAGGAEVRRDPSEPGEEPALSLAGGLTSRAPPETRPEAHGTPGALLREARERTRLDIATLAQRTRLSRRIIESIEGNRFEAIPPAYLRGYLRAVAKELGADGDSWIRAYESMGYSDPALKPNALAVRPQGRRALARSGLWYGLLAVLVVTLLGLGMYSWEGRGNPVASVGAWLGDREGFGWLNRWTGGTLTKSSGHSPEILDGMPVHGDSVVPSPSTDIEVLPLLESAPRVADEAEPVPVELVPGLPEHPGYTEWVPVDPATAGESLNAPSDLEETSIHVPGGADPADGLDRAAPVDAGEIASTRAETQQPNVSTLRLSFQDTSWVEVRSASEKVELLGVFHAGDDRVVSVGLPARVVFGNAQAVALTMDGNPVDLDPHTQRDRTARFTLDAD